jgi:hypothetical protein
MLRLNSAVFLLGLGEDAAVRRVAFEAADSGLPSPELAAGIRRVKGVCRIGVRLLETG